MTFRTLFLFSWIVLAPLVQIFADFPVTRISLAGSNAVVSWPSRTGETFVVLYRATLHINAPLTTLAAHQSAAVNTNWTSFTHTNGVLYPAPCPGNTNGPAEGPPAPGGASQASSLQGQREPYTWELEDRPPFPWDPEFVKGSSYLLTTSSMQASLLSGESGCEPPTVGFYRVFRTSPTATADFVSIQQDSGANHLEVLGNDTDPNDDKFLLASVSTAGHGTIQHLADGSVFDYTPDSGFSGTDSFTYAITNRTGGKGATTVTVFVNESGNNPPSAPSPTVTLATNVYTATIDPLSGVSDPDSDTVSLMSFTAPRTGNVTNISGQLAYTHPANYFGSDSFEYFLTDGRGGLTRVSVLIRQTDNDADEMADEWESLFALDLGVDDSNGDADSDGLPNIGEFLLRTNPRLSDNPLKLSVSPGTVVSGFAQLPLFNLNPVMESQPIGLYVDNELSPNAFFSQGADGTWMLNWDTTFVTNGNHSLKVGFQYRPNPLIGQTNSVVGTSTTVSVANQLIFDRLSSKFRNFLVIGAALANGGNANYTVELYDEDGNHLVTRQGTTVNSRIDLTWDLTDGQGTQISFGHIQARFLLGGGPGQAPGQVMQWFLKEGGFAGDGFVVAWGWHLYQRSFNQKREDMMLNAVINILGDPSSFESYNLAPPFNIPFGLTFRYDTDADKAILLNALKDNDNFFWFGHGSASSISGNTTKSSLTPGEVQKVLENFSFQSRPNKPKGDKHPYRLVILNGCETHVGTWAGVFGIDFSFSGSTDTVLDYQFTGRMPRAFVGWDASPVVPDLDPVGFAHPAYGAALAELTSRWMAGFPLEICLDFFAESATSDDFDDQDKWKISGCIDLRRTDP